MAYTNFVTIKDISTDGNALWGGASVYFLATKFNISGGNIVSSRPKTFQETDRTQTDIDNGDTTELYFLNNYNRRKSNISYTGFNNPVITISCIYNPDKVGAVQKIGDTNVSIFTPNKLLELVLKPRTVYIKDEFLHGLLSLPENNESPAIYGVNGFPVILQDWDITPSLEGKEVVMNLKFIEDQGDTTKNE